MGSSSACDIFPPEIEIPFQIGANECYNDDRRWLSLMKVKSDRQSTSSKIQLVPPMIREANGKCFDPLVVSIGPYHHGKSELQLLEDLKYKMAGMYAENDEETLLNLYTKVKDVAKAAKECYNYNADDKNLAANFKDDKFARMMFLDGCFILQFIKCIINGTFGDVEMKNNIAVCVNRDLFLLENQIPFRVLKELMIEPNDWTKLFNDFIEKFRGLRKNDSMKENRKPPAGQQQDLAIQIVQDIGEYSHLLEYARKRLIGENKSANRPRSGGDWSSYRSAKELKTAGIKFKASKTHQFTDVEFKYNILTGQLSLPPITVDDSTKSLLLNMVAYEACPDSPDDFGVTSYICFLDSLIDHAEDVKELRSEGILLNLLGSDQQVANLFNEIADNLTPNPYAYADVKAKIEKHYKNKIHIWLAEWLHTHFTSPWTLLAFIGAILALVLSVIQTYKAMYPPSKGE